jgi:hypothetical protein
VNAGWALPAKGAFCRAAKALSFSMLLLLPIGILLLTLLVLSASNLQRGFRSNWLLALSGSGLALVSLLFLRLQLPLEFSFTMWWAGEGQTYPATFLLDDVSWPLAFTAVILLLAGLLGQVRSAMSAPWTSWIPGLAVAPAAVLALSSGDALTFVFTWTLVEVLVFTWLLSLKSSGVERQAALQRMAIALFSTALLLAAWMLSFYGQQLTSILIFISVGLRLFLWTPSFRIISISNSNRSIRDLQLLSLAPSLALLARLPAVAEPARSLLLLLLLLPAGYAAGTWLLSPREESDSLWALGWAGLAAAAALSGQTSAAVAFALVLLLGLGILAFVQQVPRFRLIVALAGVALLSGLPFTAALAGGRLYSNWGSPLVFAFLAFQAAMLAGWLRRAMALGEPFLPEPWMRTIQWIGLALSPLLFILLGLGLMPSFAVDAGTIPIWPALVAMGGAFGFAMLARLRRPRLAPRVLSAFEWVFSLRWLLKLGELITLGLSGLLAFIGSLLEGQAGLLWALLFVAILLSLAGQYGLGT